MNKQSSHPVSVQKTKFGMAAPPSPASTGPVMPVTRIVPARPTTKAPHQFVSLESSPLT